LNPSDFHPVSYGAILELYWIPFRFDPELMVPVNLSIKNVPDELAERLRRRALASHRSMQGELMAILEEALREESPLTLQEVAKKVRELGLTTSDEAVQMIREDRDRR
jgi:plasmid stability protein